MPENIGTTHGSLSIEGNLYIGDMQYNIIMMDVVVIVFNVHLHSVNLRRNKNESRIIL
jgi:hypothetical protein